MNRLSVVITLVAGLGLATLAGCPNGCATVTPTPGEVADCAKESGRDVFYNLLPRVNTVLSSGTYETAAIELAKLVGEYGVAVVTCVVDAVRSRNEAAAMVATGEEQELHEQKVAYATRWLEEHGAPIQ